LILDTIVVWNSFEKFVFGTTSQECVMVVWSVGFGVLALCLVNLKISMTRWRRIWVILEMHTVARSLT
jgi:hypothetical protein